MTEGFTCSIPECGQPVAHYVIFPNRGVVSRCDACRNRTFDYPHAFPVATASDKGDEEYIPFDWPPPKRGDPVAFIGESESHIKWECMVRSVIGGEDDDLPPPLFTTAHGLWFPPLEKADAGVPTVLELPPIPDLIDTSKDST